MQPRNDSELTVAAFFDLDKTTIATATMLAFSSKFRRAGYLGRRLILKAVWSRLIFKYLGADHQRMEEMRETALKLCTGWDQQEITELVESSLEQVINPIVYTDALAEIQAHKAAGHQVFVVSASPEEIVRPLGKYLGVDGCVATIAEVDDEGRYTGRVEFYSYGKFKVDGMEALQLEYDLDLDASYAYSDSVTDLPMLEAVGHPIVVNPDRALAREAHERGWEVRHFTKTQELQRSVVQKTATGALLAGAGAAIAGGAGWYAKSRRA